MKYLGRKHDLAPKTEEEKIRVDLTEGEVMDMRFNWSTLCYNDPKEFVRLKKKKFLVKFIFLSTRFCLTGRKKTRIFDQTVFKVEGTGYLPRKQ